MIDLNRKSRDPRALLKMFNKPDLLINDMRVYYVKGLFNIPSYVIARCRISIMRRSVKKYDHLSNLVIRVTEYDILCNDVIYGRIIWDGSMYKAILNIRNPFILTVLCNNFTSILHR